MSFHRDRAARIGITIMLMGCALMTYGQGFVFNNFSSSGLGGDGSGGCIRTSTFSTSASQKPDDPSTVLMELSKAEIQLRNADIEASRAEASLGESEEIVANWCIIASIAILFLGLVTVTVLASKGF